MAKSPFAANERAKERSPLSRYCLAARSLRSVGLGCVFSAALKSPFPCNESCCARQLSPTLPMASVPPPPTSCLRGFTVGETTIHLSSGLAVPCCPVSFSQATSPAVQPLPSLHRPQESCRRAQTNLPALQRGPIATGQYPYGFQPNHIKQHIPSWLSQP